MNLIRTALIALCSLLATSAHAAWVNIDELHANDLPPGTSGVQFGKSIAADVRADGSVRALYVGAPNATVVVNDVSYAAAGVVYVLTRSGNQWSVFGAMHAAGQQANAHFGAAIAIHNGTLIIGEPDFDAPGGHTNSGRVHFWADYRWNSALPDPVIVSMSSRTLTLDNARLGASVAVTGGGLNTIFGSPAGSDGSYIVTGAPGAVGAGCTYFNRAPADFHNSGGMQDLGSVCSGTSGDAFGSSVAALWTAAGQALMIVGAPGTMQGGNAAAGAAYEYARVSGNYTLIDTLLPPNPAFLDSFGTSVGIDEDYVYVGGTGRDLAGVGRTGSVSIFTPANILGYDFLTERFPAAPRGAGDLCGASLSTNAGGVGIVLGCPGSDGSVTDQGAVRLITPFILLGNTVWIDQRVALADEPHGADDLGRSAVLADGHVYAGAPFADDAVGINNGGVFEFASGLTVDDLFADGFE